jgi:hypothetical protein
MTGRVGESGSSLVLVLVATSVVEVVGADVLTDEQALNALPTNTKISPLLADIVIKIKPIPKNIAYQYALSCQKCG